MKEKVVVGMSGGVDSSVAAYLLKEQGYDVIGVTMQIWQDQDVFVQSQEGGCCGLSAVDDARRVAERLEIPYYVMNFKEDFHKYVIDYFVSEYEKARTPNPCIACNRYVKWESLLHRSLEIGADYIATGISVWESCSCVRLKRRSDFRLPQSMIVRISVLYRIMIMPLLLHRRPEKKANRVILSMKKETLWDSTAG